MTDEEYDVLSATPEARLERALLLLEECEAIVMRHQEEHGGQGDLLKKLQRVLG